MTKHTSPSTSHARAPAIIAKMEATMMQTSNTTFKVLIGKEQYEAHSVRNRFSSRDVGRTSFCWTFFRPCALSCTSDESVAVVSVSAKVTSEIQAMYHVFQICMLRVCGTRIWKYQLVLITITQITSTTRHSSMAHKRSTAAVVGSLLRGGVLFIRLLFFGRSLAGLDVGLYIHFDRSHSNISAFGKASSVFSQAQR